MAIIETLINRKPQDDGPFFYSSEEEEITVICKHPEKLKLLVDAIAPDKIVHFISEGSWSMINLVTELLKKYNHAVLYFTTYALREFSVKQLITALQKKQLIAINILIDNKAKTRTPDAFKLAEMNVSRIFLTNIHAKVCVIQTPEATISINASANWTTNPRIESGTITMNKEVGQFHIDWMEKIMSNAEVFK